MREAPWPDYQGNRLFEGDIIRHPSGEEGVIVYVPRNESYSISPWCVHYDDGGLSALSLQVGSKGRAVKVPSSIDMAFERLRVAWNRFLEALKCN